MTKSKTRRHSRECETDSAEFEAIKREVLALPVVKKLVPGAAESRLCRASVKQFCGISGEFVHNEIS